MFRILQRSISGIHAPVAVIFGMTLASYLLALIRVNFLATTFGAGAELDLYFAAFRIPDLIFITAGSFITSFALIPFFTKHEESGDLNKQLDMIFTVYFFFLAVVSLIVGIFSPAIQGVIFPGFSQEQQEIVTTLTRIMLLQPMVFSLSYLFSSIVQVKRRFLIFSLSPIFYNVGIIFGIVFLSPSFGISGVAMGVVFGAFLHLLFPLLSIIKDGIKPRFSKISREGFREILYLVKLSIPRTFAISFTRFTEVFFISIASLFTVGSISIFTLSFDLHVVPLTLIGVSYSIASFPLLSKLWLDDLKEDFNKIVCSGIRYVIFFSLPISAYIILFHKQAVNVVYGFDSFSATEFNLITISLVILVSSILFSGILQVLTRAYYAKQNTLIPFVVNFLVMVLSISLVFIFLKLFNNGYINGVLSEVFSVSLEGLEVLMLPISYVVGVVFGCILILSIFNIQHKVKLIRELGPSFIQQIFAVAILSFTASGLINATIQYFNQGSFLAVLLNVSLVGVVSLLLWLATLYVLKNRELGEIISFFMKKYGQRN